MQTGIDLSRRLFCCKTTILWLAIFYATFIQQLVAKVAKFAKYANTVASKKKAFHLLKCLKHAA
jgi:hypothetical protein